MSLKIARRGLTALCLIFFMTACQSKPKPLSEWESYKKDFFVDLWKTFPGWAASQGLVEYADQFKIPDDNYRTERMAFYQKYQTRLDGISKTTLNTLDGMDYELLQNYLKSAVWDETVFKSTEWDPSQYNMGDSIGSILESAKLKEEEKINLLSIRLLLAPRYYEAAFANIKTPTREHTEHAIQQNRGLITFLEGDVKTRIDKSPLASDEKARALKNLGTAVQAVRDYIKNLTDLKAQLEKSKGFRSFRIGKALYAQKFQFDLQSRYTAEEMYLKAVKEKQDLHKEMRTRARELWPKYFGKTPQPASATVLIRTVLDRIARDHVEPSQFVATVEKMLPRLSQFIVEKNLLTLDPTRPLKVRATPAYSGGFASASVDAPGPFDTARETFYNVTPLDGLPPAKQQSFLREYNNYTLQILNIHEALPGHYVQLIYNTHSPSLVKAIFGNNALVEGWAVYGERMMMEEGYGDNSPELWMMYDKWRLREVCNVILDYSLHSLNMSKESVTRLLKNEAFQEDSQIEEKWNRATYSQVQLASYFTGFSEIYDLRAEMKKVLGGQFNLKHFNESFLSYGSSPIKFIREDMMRAPGVKAGPMKEAKP